MHDSFSKATSTTLTTVYARYSLIPITNYTEGEAVADIRIVDAEFYTLVSDAGELVQNPGRGDVETPAREGARSIPGASSVSNSGRAGGAIDSRCGRLINDIGQFKDDVEEAIKAMSGTDQQVAAAMDKISSRVKGSSKSTGQKGKGGASHG